MMSVLKFSLAKLLKNEHTHLYEDESEQNFQAAEIG
jgi:hypothetical protein